MTINRDVAQDRAATRGVLAGQRSSNDDPANWLGHQAGIGAAKIDKLLIVGATFEQLGETRGAVKNHLSHLLKEHGLSVVETDNVFAFDRQSLGLDAVSSIPN